MSGKRLPRPRRGRPVEIRVDGRKVSAFEGETVFAVLCLEGVFALRRPGEGHPPRGALCGMGVCQECRVTIDGIPDRRACMTRVREGMEIETGGR
ncbi:MAG: (2Fe-2S)-binding protein [Desulfobacterales bacterium]